MGDFISNYFAFYFLHLSMEQEQGNIYGTRTGKFTYSIIDDIISFGCD